MIEHYCVSEKAIEHYFCEQMRRLSLPCIKQFNPYEAGWPDRLVLLPGGLCWWVEFKSRGKKPTQQQLMRHAKLRAIGHSVEVISSRSQAEDLVEKIKLLANYTTL